MKDKTLGYNTVLQYMTDPEFQRNMSINPTDVLLKYGITDTGDQQEILNILTCLWQGMSATQKISKLMEDSSNSTMATVERFKESIRNSLKEIDNGFRAAKIMYTTAFYFGLMLILASIVFAFVKEKMLLSIVFGSLGTMDILVFFITKPPVGLQKSLISLAQLEASFISWFTDSINLNTFLLQYSQQGKELPYEIMDKISDKIINNTERTLKMMKEFCEPSEK